jgi:hypothetical protein
MGTKSTNSLTIGSKCFLVSRSYAFQNKWGGKILLAKVVTFQNIAGNIEPVFKEIGNSKVELTVKNYIPFVDIQTAIDSIITKK